MAQLQAVVPALMVLEATGGDQRAVVAALAAAGLPVVVVNPRQARDCAKATGQLAKTDGLDARALAHVADAVRPAPRPWPDAQTEERRALLARRRQRIGMRTAEPNRLSGVSQRLAALVGVAPLNRDSGTLRGTRTTWGGRAHVRVALDKSPWVAVRDNPGLNRFSERLRAAGKAAKVALTACMRKLLTILNAMVKHQTLWQPQEEPIT